jgi:periplasmic protein CpxP/Spy
MLQVTGRKSALLFTSALFSAALLTAPVFAQGSPPLLLTQATTKDNVAPGSPGDRSHHMGARGHSTPERVEARIKQLHANLKITTAQEAQWKAVADTMRANARGMEDAVAVRERALKTMTVMDDLRSYEGMAATHADGLHKLVATFGPLYESMTPEQRKVADAEFQGYRKRAASKKEASSQK